MKYSSLLFSALFFFSINTSAQNFKNIVAFGDSFTDNGYINGHGFNRDTNGLVWVEYFAEMINCRLVDNRAWGGARTDDGHYLGFDWSGFNWQVDKYEMRTSSEETLFTVWIGVNDYWDNKDDPSNSVRNIKTGLNKLIEKGGKHFVIFNNFDLTLSLGYGPETKYHSLIPVVQELTKKFNSELAIMLFDKKTGLLQLHPEIKLYFVDIYTFMNDLVAKNQFNEKPWKGTYKFPEPKEYLWYDEWHPMTSYHKQIAELALKELKK
ncbi:MAG: SGNH/GDSL hydrolase family protein [Maribacter sp.]|nr:SGNH/GDSL hydrolase family protein [Eudoraea sp.]MBT8298858.1 SGNH/GDSL hydrolase family protein [Maribacter sp.]NNL01064.1 SGNH/GDSL hydrolase family protein [Eudoraea sp.]